MGVSHNFNKQNPKGQIIDTPKYFKPGIIYTTRINSLIFLLNDF